VAAGDRLRDIARGLQSTFGGSIAAGAATGEIGGHWNFTFQLQFPSFGAASAFTSTYAASAAGGWPPPARFGTGPALHLKSLSTWSVNGGGYCVGATAHLDLFNPDTGLGQAIGSPSPQIAPPKSPPVSRHFGLAPFDSLIWPTSPRGFDVLVTVSGGHSFVRQYEYNGLGQLRSVCEVTSATGSATCLQSVQPIGYWTKYT